MKNWLKICIFLSLSYSYLFSNEVEEFYRDTKLYIKFVEGDNKIFKNEETFYKISYVKGYFVGLIDYSNWYKNFYNLYNEEKHPELFDDKLDNKICLDNVSDYQLAKTYIKFLDNNPEFFNKGKLISIWGAISYYECKK